MSQTATPATLSDVIRGVRDLFWRVSDGTTIQNGKEFRKDFGVGSPPKILFVQDEEGEAGPALATGARQIAGVFHSCAVYVRATEDGTDDGRLDAAYALADRAMNAIKASGSGRVAFKKFVDGSPTDVNAFGAQVYFTFTYRRPVYEDAAIFAAAFAANPSPIAPPRPDQPQGDTGVSFSTGSVTTTDTRP